MTGGDRFTFYFGAASGSARKALQKLEESNVMLSYTTRNNQPWDCKNLFIDSGGYSLIKTGGEHGWPEDEWGEFPPDKRQREYQEHREMESDV